MTVFLLVVNFIIDGVVILGLFLLFTKMKNEEQNFENQERIAREIEGTFQAYLEEIKEENRRFERHMKTGPSKVQEVPPAGEHVDRAEKGKEYAPPLTDEEDVVEFSEETKALQMYQNGVEPEDIARKLGVGKTEVELMLKFQRR